MGRLMLVRCAAMALLASLPVSAAASAQLLQNGRFTATSGGVPTAWRLEAWAKDQTDVGWEPGTDGGGLARIVNRGPNDARLCQSISVTPGAEYRVTARVKTENVGHATAGALIAIEPRVADSVDLKGTQDWQTLEVSAKNQDAASWDVCLRLGSYANLNTGTAWFTDVRVDVVGGAAPQTGSRWPSLGIGAMVASVRTASWSATAIPLVAGLVLAFGLGVLGRRYDG
jgi:hypothetical protein